MRPTTRAFLFALFALLLPPRESAAQPDGAIWLSGAEIQSYAYEATTPISHVGFDTTIKRSGAAAFAVK